MLLFGSGGGISAIMAPVLLLLLDRLFYRTGAGIKRRRMPLGDVMYISDLNWKKWLKSGGQYLRAATPKSGKSRFGGTIQYNLLSMSLESYVMAILDYHQSLPENHTFTDLMAGLESVVQIDEDLKKRILSYENIQSICSIEKYHRSEPSNADLSDLMDAVMEIGAIANRICSSDQPVHPFSAL